MSKLQMKMARVACFFKGAVTSTDQAYLLAANDFEHSMLSNLKWTGCFISMAIVGTPFFHGIMTRGLHADLMGGGPWAEALKPERVRASQVQKQPLAGMSQIIYNKGPKQVYMLLLPLQPALEKGVTKGEG